MLDVLIVGAGPAGLFAADRLSAGGATVTVVDRMPSPARKFLMAGRGGLNLTHSEDLTGFLTRYREAEPFLAPIIRAFPPEALADWCHDLGEETFVGSSGRVFPKSMKASPLLRAWLRRLDKNGVRLLTRHMLTGIDETGTAHLQAEEAAPAPFPARAVLLALGGASWPRLGSNAAWVPLLEARGIRVNPLQPANCGFQVDWSVFVKERFAGTPLKRIALSHGTDKMTGELVISEQGLEGGAIYALSAALRERIATEGEATLAIDLRPSMSLKDLTGKLSRPRGKQSVATFLKKAIRAKPAELALLHECLDPAGELTKNLAGGLPSDPAALAQRIKAVPIRCLAPYAIDRAISSAGGIALDELDDALMLRKLPGVFAAGEMLDWEAPTGGYLLQACVATAARAAEGIAAYLKTEGGR
ncbi:TIGR03862 family flavoprotein [Roseibium sp.]|uniref:NAD(P)/FAD-dependent oxidoreductase n=1 Tax=Roseibium sp. TaxID=1936156 RepID=UPI003265A496